VRLGFYRDAGDTTSHGSGIVVVNGSATDSIDFVIDFGNMHAHLHLLPARAREGPCCRPPSRLLAVRAVSAQESAVVYGSVRDSSGQPLRATLRVVNGDGASVADAQGR